MGSCQECRGLQRMMAECVSRLHHLSYDAASLSAMGGRTQSFNREREEWERLRYRLYALRECYEVHRRCSGCNPPSANGEISDSEKQPRI
jgi:hypothetical protein